MSDLPPSEPLLPVPTPATANTHCTAADYERLYAASIADPDDFWAEQAKRLDWVTQPPKNATWSFDPVRIQRYEDGVVPPCRNALDPPVPAGLGDRPAIISGSDAPECSPCPTTSPRRPAAV